MQFNGYNSISILKNFGYSQARLRKIQYKKSLDN